MLGPGSNSCGEYADNFSDSCEPGLAICGMRPRVDVFIDNGLPYVDKMAMTDIRFTCCTNRSNAAGTIWI